MEEITIVDIKPQLVLGMHKRGGYEEIANIIPKLAQFAVQNNIQITGPPVFICHEITMEESMIAAQEKNADVEVAIPISQKVDGKEEMKSYELPGGKMVKIVHKGPYQDCGPTYEKLYAWLAENSKKIVGPTREIYLNDPNQVSPEELLTEIYAPIE